MLFAKVKKEIAEKTRQRLIKAGVLSRDIKVIKDGHFIYFPVVRRIENLEMVELKAEPLPPKYVKLKDLLSGFLSEAEMEKVITSFDVIGDLVIIEIPQALEQKEKKIAQAILEVHKNCKTVAKKTGAMAGEFRVRPLKIIAGEKRTETLYKEHGVKMKLDPSKVYFSVRLATERKRIAELVRTGERILALFAGVGPFPLVISKSHPDCEIVAIELNPDAVEYMRQNTRLNKTKNIKAILGDAREAILKDYLNWADRVLMPLPHKAETFLDVAIAGVKDGGIIHFYGFASESEWQTAFEDKIREACKTGHSTLDTVHRKIVRPYAPGIVQVVIDFRVKK